MNTIIQLGSTRDGLEPYKEAAKTHSFTCVLVETPEYLKFREELGRQKFIKTIAVNHPADADEVIKAIKDENISPLGIIAGFERYNYAAYTIAKKLDILPYDKNYPFKPLTKIEQRKILMKLNSPMVLQPKFILLKNSSVKLGDIKHLRFPLIIKPIDGSAGTGTFLIKDHSELIAVIEELKKIKNFDGGDFSGFMLEEFIKGQEYSVQGFVRNKKLTILSCGKKFIFTENYNTEKRIFTVFREAGTVMVGKNLIDNNIKQFTKKCVEAFKYKNGAFHIDFKKTNHGNYFLEKGFRISGLGISKLVEQISGYDWGEEAFISLLKLPSVKPKKPIKTICIGEVRARLTPEIERALILEKTNKNVKVTIINAQQPSFSSDRLLTDITRHMGTIGKITLKGKTIKQVENLLLKCLVERIPRRIT